MPYTAIKKSSVYIVLLIKLNSKKRQLFFSMFTFIMHFYVYFLKITHKKDLQSM